MSARQGVGEWCQEKSQQRGEVLIAKTDPAEFRRLDTGRAGAPGLERGVTAAPSFES